jgi:hypothetical protein
MCHFCPHFCLRSAAINCAEPLPGVPMIRVDVALMNLKRGILVFPERLSSLLR